MKIELLPYNLTVAKIKTAEGVDFGGGLVFLCKTDSELSLVCETGRVPCGVDEREDGWRAFRVKGQLDFGLVGILADISGRLARCGIPIFAVSTFDTDYILVKAERFADAVRALEDGGCTKV